MLTLNEGDAVRRGARRRLGRAKLAPSALLPLSEISCTDPASTTTTTGKRKRRRRKGAPAKQRGNTGKLHAKRMKKLVTQDGGQGMEPLDPSVAMSLSNDDTYVPSDLPQGYKPWTVLPDDLRDELSGNMKFLGDAITKRTIRPSPAQRSAKGGGGRGRRQTNRIEKPCLTEQLNSPAHKHAPIPDEQDDDDDGEDRNTVSGSLDHLQNLELTALSLYEDFEALCRSLQISKEASWWSEKTCAQIASLFRERLGLEVHQYILTSDHHRMYVAWNLDVDQSRFYGCLILALTATSGQDAVDAIRVWNSNKLTGAPLRQFYFPCVCQRMKG